MISRKPCSLIFRSVACSSQVSSVLAYPAIRIGSADLRPQVLSLVRHPMSY